MSNGSDYSDFSAHRIKMEKTTVLLSLYAPKNIHFIK
jgi:hypothetical protein